MNNILSKKSASQNQTPDYTSLVVLIIHLLLMLPFNIGAQSKLVPYLEREVTIVAQDKSIEDVLSDISNQAGFIFSYSPEALRSSNKVTVNIQNKPVRIVLNQLFKEEVSYKAKGKYVILKKLQSPKNLKDETIKLEGYVYDSRTGKKLTDASIYDKNLMVSTVTNEYGYFSVNVPVNKPITALKVSKLGYGDTALITTINEQRLRTVEVSLNAKDSVHVKKWQSFINLDKIVPQWLIPKKIKVNALNINDSIFKAVQVSLMPYVTTNHFLGGNVINDFSFNATVGYIQGVRIAEFGGIVNIVRDNASYAQFGGVGNIVGGRFTGFQGGGTFNYASEVKGVQAAGVVNLAGDADIQASGVINKAIDNIVQAAGVINWAKNSDIQASGVINKAYKNIVQVSGVVNWARETNVQVSGVINRAMDVKSAQIGGIVNTAFNNAPIQVAGCVNSVFGTTEIQVSPLVNYAGNVKKFQIAMVNIADSCQGIPIGLFSFVKQGYHKLEFSVDELFPLNIAFRTGVKRFHTIFSAGSNPFRYSTPLWTYGYGLGTSFGKTDKFLFDLDLSFNQIIYGGKFSSMSHLYRLYFGLDKRIYRKISIAAGLTYNLMFADTNDPDYNSIYSKLQPYSLTNSTFVNGMNLKTWIGARLAIRFL